MLLLGNGFYEDFIAQGNIIFEVYAYSPNDTDEDITCCIHPFRSSLFLLYFILILVVFFSFEILYHFSYILRTGFCKAYK